MTRVIVCLTMIFLMTAGCGKASTPQSDSQNGGEVVAETFTWEEPILIHNQTAFDSSGEIDARNIHAEKFGAEYARMVVLNDGRWLSVYTIYDNNGYLQDAKGGTSLAFSISEDEGKTWRQISILRHPSRDLDNGQMILDENGDILLSCRSVRWQESYQLPVYKSKTGVLWEFVSIIDENNAAPGVLGKPDKGMYEPHFYRLDDGRLSVMYANEKHVTEAVPYSQIISQRISEDDGKTWGEEIFVAWDSKHPEYRPGMPVWLRLKDGRYFVVFEIVINSGGTSTADIYFKVSDDGIHWSEGNGVQIPRQWGGPFVEQLESGRLVVTSNAGEISYSDDIGETWKPIYVKPFPKFLWPSLYSPDGERVIIFNAAERAEGGHNIQLRAGKFVK